MGTKAEASALRSAQGGKRRGTRAQNAKAGAATKNAASLEESSDASSGDKIKSDAKSDNAKKTSEHLAKGDTRDAQASDLADEETSDEAGAPDLKAAAALEAAKKAQAPSKPTKYVVPKIAKMWKVPPGQKLNLPTEFKLDLPADMPIVAGAKPLSPEDIEKLRKLMHNQPQKHMKGLTKEQLKKILAARKDTDRPKPGDSGGSGATDTSRERKREDTKKAERLKPKQPRTVRAPHEQMASLPPSLTSPFHLKPWTPAWHRYATAIKQAETQRMVGTRNPDGKPESVKPEAVKPSGAKRGAKVDAKSAAAQGDKPRNDTLAQNAGAGPPKTRQASANNAQPSNARNGAPANTQNGDASQQNATAGTPDIGTPNDGMASNDAQNGQKNLLDGAPVPANGMTPNPAPMNPAGNGANPLNGQPNSNPQGGAAGDQGQNAGGQAPAGGQAQNGVSPANQVGGKQDDNRNNGQTGTAKGDMLNGGATDGGQAGAVAGGALGNGATGGGATGGVASGAPDGASAGAAAGGNKNGPNGGVLGDSTNAANGGAQTGNAQPNGGNTQGGGMLGGGNAGAASGAGNGTDGGNLNAGQGNVAQSGNGAQGGGAAGQGGANGGADNGGQGGMLGGGGAGGQGSQGGGMLGGGAGGANGGDQGGMIGAGGAGSAGGAAGGSGGGGSLSGGGQGGEGGSFDSAMEGSGMIDLDNPAGEVADIAGESNSEDTGYTPAQGVQPNMPEHNREQQRGLPGALVLPPLPPMGVEKGTNPLPQPVKPSRRAARPLRIVLIPTPRATAAAPRPRTGRAAIAPRRQQQKPPVLVARPLQAPPVEASQKRAQAPIAPADLPPALSVGSLSTHGTVDVAVSARRRLPLGSVTELVNPPSRLDLRTPQRAPQGRRLAPRASVAGTSTRDVSSPSPLARQAQKRDGADAQEVAKNGPTQNGETLPARKGQSAQSEIKGKAAVRLSGAEFFALIEQLQASPDKADKATQAKKANNSMGVKEGTKTPLPPTPLPDSDAEIGDGSGLKGEYYLGRNFDQYQFTRADPNLDLFWGGDNSPSPKLPVGTDWTIRWTGKIEPRYSEEYTIYGVADDGVRVWIDHKLIIDAWTLHPLLEYEGKFTFKAGKQYDIRVDYFEGAGPPAMIGVYWESRSQVKEFVPEDRLFYPLAGDKADLEKDEPPHR